MIFSALCFLCGIIILHQLAVLPNLSWLILSFVMLPLAYRWRKLLPLVWLLAGFIWAWLNAYAHHQQAFPEGLQGHDIQVTGEIISVPDISAQKSQFLLRLVRPDKWLKEQWPHPGIVRLSWYKPKHRLQPGQTWSLTVRLKKPHGFSNPAGFDFEGWLFQQGIHATGYVRKVNSARMIQQTRNLQSIRYHLYQLLNDSLQEARNKGMIIALALGIRSHISQSDWHKFQRTGTGHLIAISGLHIGLVAGIFFFLSQWLWRQSSRLCLRLPAPKAAALFALAGAIIYAFLAGFAIPTQRAMAMIFIVMLAVMADRTHRPAQVLSLALWFVLLLDPHSILSAGFWLSFCAVAILLYGMTGRYRPYSGWKSWSRAQWLVSIGLLPLTLYLFQQASIISPVANLIAIPWVSFLIVPLVLAGTLVLMIHIPAGDFILHLADLLLMPLHSILTTLAVLPYAQWIQPAPTIWVLMAAVLAIALLLAPSGLPVKRLGVLFLLPVFLVSPSAIPPAGYRLTVLDVGQGLAAVIETAQHVLVYDVGPKSSDRFDTGQTVVLPFLYHRNIKYIDRLVVSHGDNDHRGGFEAVQKNIAIGTVYSGTPQALLPFQALTCQQSMHWQWDGVDFTFLHPDTHQAYKKNDRSCVLKISSSAGSVLLTGDIHKKSERALLARSRSMLAADILIAPHHGSKTSSHPEFVSAVSASYVIFTAGYNNRFRHPHKDVVQRYQDNGAVLLDSGSHGAIEFQLRPDKTILPPRTYRQWLARHWKHNTLPARDF